MKRKAQTSFMVPREPTQHIPWSVSDPSFEGYAEVYRAAAKELAGDHDTGELWAYPIVFLYRQAIELLIKAILTTYGPDHGISQESVLARGHDLAAQLPDLKKVAKSCHALVSQDLDDLLSEWSEIDKNNTRARYPTNREGEEENLVPGHTFDLKRLVSRHEAGLAELEELMRELERREMALQSSHAK